MGCEKGKAKLGFFAEKKSPLLVMTGEIQGFV